MDNKGFEDSEQNGGKNGAVLNSSELNNKLDLLKVEQDNEGGVPLRRLSKRVSIVIDENDRIWAPSRRASRLSGKLSLSGIENPDFVGDGTQTPMSEVHLGHSVQIRRKSLSYLKKELEIDYHEIPIETLYNRLGSHPTQGLSDGQVKRNVEKFGKNALTPPKQEPTWLKFIKTLVGGFQLLLWTGAILSFAAYVAQRLQSDTPPQDNLYLGSVLAILVIVLGCFTFYQEYSSGKIMESFSKMVPSYANCIRNGKLQVIDATDLVVGDIVDVKFGDRIPADIRIIEAYGFKVDNSSLTGESDPQLRITECTDENPMETKNLAFFSTNALEGTAKGIVVSVGDNTFIGRIAGLASGLDSSDTPLAREVEHFIILISAVAVFFGVTFFITSLVMGYKLIDSALFLIGIIVANVPEGLLVTFTVILALTAKRMANKNCLVKQLHAVETLGSTTVICSDKTGTLTQNRMTVNHMWFANKIHEANAGIKFDKEDPGFKALTRVGSLCSRAAFLADQQDLPIQQRKVNGDASEAAILRCMEENVGDMVQYRAQTPKIFEIPFNSTNKWQLSIHETTVDGRKRYLMVMKGAPERIINYCTQIVIGPKEYLLDSDWKDTFNSKYEELGGMGERVLGFCDMLLPEEDYPIGFKFSEDNTEYLKLGLRFVGLMSMIDPPRPGVPEAVKTCRSAGIKVVMVTGDHPITARAIAKNVGIISPENETLQERAKRLNMDEFDVDASDIVAIVVKGDDLMEFSTEQLDEVLKDHKEIVFARVSPQQKLVIVEGFQRLNEVVAVTGDGVNDSPALKKADIGIAMGIAGSDVSKQAADMILLDDNFASIVTGVEEGRLIFENLKKCICYLLAANIAELVPFIVFITLRIPLPLGTIPMLMICLGTDIVPTISLSYEKPEGDIMKRPPRDPIKDNLVTDRLISYSYGQLGVIESVAGMFAYFVVMAQNGFIPNDLLGLAPKWDNPVLQVEDSYGQEWGYPARKQLEHTCWTAYFCTVVVCQWGNLLVSKTRRVSLVYKLFDNWIVFLGIFVETAIACILAYTPGLNYAVSYAPIYFMWWLPGVPFCLLIIFYDEFRRLLLRNWNNKWFQHEFYY